MVCLAARNRSRIAYKFLSVFIAFTFTFTSIIPPSYAQSLNLLNLPVPGTMVPPSQAFVPLLLKGMIIHPEDPFRFDFIIDSGNSKFSPDEIKTESQRLVKYFLASLTVPKDDLWVNLSPYEGDRIIPDELGKTELGRDLLAQDYILKQLTASLMYPEKELGKEFWDRVYKKAEEKYGTSQIPVNTFNKVWILPESATVYENGQTVYVVESRLKVMLEEDYMAMEKNVDNDAGTGRDLSLQADIVREIILPEIEREVNEGKNFAPLRQIYHSLILAKWYKETVKESLLSKVYVDQKKIAGVNVDDETIKDQIYERYIEAYKQGVFNYIKEDYDRLSQEMIPRKYFSGGFKGDIKIKRSSSAVRDSDTQKHLVRMKIEPQGDASSLPAKNKESASPMSLWRARVIVDYSTLLFGNSLSASKNNTHKITLKKAIKALGNKRKKADVERLRLLMGEHPQYRRQIIDALSNIGGKEATQAIKMGLSHIFGDQEMVELARKYLPYDVAVDLYSDGLPGKFAIKALQGLGGLKATEAIKSALDNPDDDIKKKAKKNFQEINTVSREVEWHWYSTSTWSLEQGEDTTYHKPFPTRINAQGYQQIIETVLGIKCEIKTKFVEQITHYKMDTSEYTQNHFLIIPKEHEEKVIELIHEIDVAEKFIHDDLGLSEYAHLFTVEKLEKKPNLLIRSFGKKYGYKQSKYNASKNGIIISGEKKAVEDYIKELSNEKNDNKKLYWKREPLSNVLIPIDTRGENISYEEMIKLAFNRDEDKSEPVERDSTGEWHVDLQQVVKLINATSPNINALKKFASNDHYWVRIIALSRLVDLNVNFDDDKNLSPEDKELKHILEAYKAISKKARTLQNESDREKAILKQALSFQKDDRDAILNEIGDKPPTAKNVREAKIQLRKERVNARRDFIPPMTFMETPPSAKKGARHFPMARWAKRYPKMEKGKVIMKVVKQSTQLAPIILLWQFAYDIAKLKTEFDGENKEKTFEAILGHLIDEKALDELMEKTKKELKGIPVKKGKIQAEQLGELLVKISHSEFNQSDTWKMGSMLVDKMGRLIGVGYNGEPLAQGSDMDVTFTDLRVDDFMKNIQVNPEVHGFYASNIFENMESQDLRDNRPDLRRSICAEQKAALYAILKARRSGKTDMAISKFLKTAVLHGTYDPCNQCAEYLSNLIKGASFLSNWTDPQTVRIFMEIFNTFAPLIKRMIGEKKIEFFDNNGRRINQLDRIMKFRKFASINFPLTEKKKVNDREAFEKALPGNYKSIDIQNILESSPELGDEKTEGEKILFNQVLPYEKARHDARATLKKSRYITDRWNSKRQGSAEDLIIAIMNIGLDGESKKDFARLLQLLSHENAMVRSEALKAIQQVDNVKARIIEDLKKRLHDEIRPIDNKRYPDEYYVNYLLAAAYSYVAQNTDFQLKFQPESRHKQSGQKIKKYAHLIPVEKLNRLRQVLKDVEKAEKNRSAKLEEAKQSFKKLAKGMYVLVDDDHRKHYWEDWIVDVPEKVEIVRGKKLPPASSRLSNKDLARIKTQDLSDQEINKIFKNAGFESSSDADQQILFQYDLLNQKPAQKESFNNLRNSNLSIRENIERLSAAYDEISEKPINRENFERMIWDSLRRLHRWIPAPLFKRYYTDLTPAHGISHALNVLEMSLKIVMNDPAIRREIMGSQNTLEDLVIAALSHDLSTIVSRVKHEKNSSKWLSAILENEGFDNPRREGIASIAFGHKKVKFNEDKKGLGIRKEHKNHAAAKVIHDADRLAVVFYPDRVYQSWLSWSVEASGYPRREEALSKNKFYNPKLSLEERKNALAQNLSFSKSDGVTDLFRKIMYHRILWDSGQFYLTIGAMVIARDMDKSAAVLQDFIENKRNDLTLHYGLDGAGVESIKNILESLYQWADATAQNAPFHGSWPISRQDLQRVKKGDILTKELDSLFTTYRFMEQREQSVLFTTDLVNNAASTDFAEFQRELQEETSSLRGRINGIVAQYAGLAPVNEDGFRKMLWASIELLYKWIPTPLFKRYYSDATIIPAHGISHALNVIEQSIKIIKNDSNIQEEIMDTLEDLVIATLAHDLSMILFRENHEANSAGWLSAVLRRERFDEPRVERIAAIALGHRKAKPNEEGGLDRRPEHENYATARVIHDADRFDTIFNPERMYQTNFGWWKEGEKPARDFTPEDLAAWFYHPDDTIETRLAAIRTGRTGKQDKLTELFYKVHVPRMVDSNTPFLTKGAKKIMEKEDVKSNNIDYLKTFIDGKKTELTGTFGFTNTHVNQFLKIISELNERLSVSSPTSGKAPGGIDLNDITVDREGAGVDIQFSPVDIQNVLDMKIDGFAPIIIDLVPLPSVLPLLGLEPRDKEEDIELSSLN